MKDYAGNKPQSIVRAGNANGAPQIALSTDGGVTWSPSAATDNNKSGGTLAYSADADTILWSSGNAGVLRSQNQATFAAVSGVPSGAAIAADKRNNTVFYAGSGGDFYRSSDTAATFTKTASAFGSTVTSIQDVAAHPAVAGEVWVSTNAGLFRSTNYGASFTAVGAGSLSNTQQIAFGKGSGTTWNLYAFGTGSAGAKLYASADGGASWVDIQGSQGFGSIGSNKLAGSGNVAGQVYVGTNGRGVFVAQVSVAGGGSGPTSSSTSTVSKTSTTVISSPPTTMTTSTVKTTSLTTTSVKTTTTTTVKSSTTTAAPQPTQSHWGQCGGQGVS